MRLGFTLSLLMSIPCLVAGQAHYLARVTGGTVKVRLGPGTDFPVLGLLARDTHAITCGKTDGWYRIYLPRDFHVYLHGNDLSVTGKKGVLKRDSAGNSQWERWQGIRKSVWSDSTDRGGRWNRPCVSPGS